MIQTALSSQAVVVHEILKYTEDPEKSTVLYGVGLSFALFASEFSKAFLISLLWAVNLRTAARLKGAYSLLAFQKVISLRGNSGILKGEVGRDLIHRNHMTRRLGDLLLWMNCRK